jgi:hypothetical protein
VSETCWLCHRPLGRRVEQHHPVPKSRGGRDTVPLHPICHRKLHVRFTNQQLARIGDERAKLASDEEIAAFLQWLDGKPHDFHAPTRRPRR